MRRILLVEDEAIIAMTTEDMLDELGYEKIVTAASVAQALAAIADTQFDAALLDVNLDGEFSTPVAAALDAQRVPYALATGYGSAAPGIVSSNAPVITKPYTAATLAATIAGLLKG
ncbi:response regulator [Sphingomonas sp. 1P06PA]|uniref:response regulator n=1 Tax=Sphingomonas sp. 1P06PA TaxID=554121 RepID=UPI0039A45E86